MSGGKKALGAPEQCARRGRAEDAADGAREMAHLLKQMDADVIRRMVQAREAAMNIHKAFPGGDQRFMMNDDEDDDDEAGDVKDDQSEGRAHSDDDDEEDGQQDDDGGETCFGLFDNSVNKSAHTCLQRLKEDFDLDLVHEMDDAKLDFLQRIRVVNWIRTLIRVKDCSAEDTIVCLRLLLREKGESADVHVLDDDIFLKPVIKGDLLLTVLESEDKKDADQGPENGNGQDTEEEELIRDIVTQALRAEQLNGQSV